MKKLVATIRLYYWTRLRDQCWATSRSSHGCLCSLCRRDLDVYSVTIEDEQIVGRRVS